MSPKKLANQLCRAIIQNAAKQTIESAIEFTQPASEKS